MRVLVAAAGSYGDVAPYTGLGARLREAGHDVTLATQESFAPLVRGAGLGFRPLSADTGGAGRGGNRQLMRTAAAFVRELGVGLLEAAEPGADVLLLSTTTAPLGRQLAEAMDVPSLGVYLQPTHPTREFAPVVSGGRSLGGPGNRALGRFASRMADRVYADAVAD
ncbi:MAG: glycosyltransferase, partial [Streptomyces sp.]